MARTNGPIQVWSRNDTTPTDVEGGYAGGDSTAAAVGTSLDQSSRALGTVDNLAVTASTLDYGQEATATISGAPPWKTIHVGIPKGMPDSVGAQLVADSQTTTAAAQQAATESAASSDWAQQAQAAAYNVPDTAMRDIIGNPATLTADALDSKFGVISPESAGATANGTTDDRDAIQACIDASQGGAGTVVLSAGRTYAVASSLVARPGASIRIEPGARIRRAFSGGPVVTNSAFTEKVNDFTITGPGTIGSDDFTTAGQVLSLYGDDIILTEFTIDTYTGGQAVLIGGDRVRMAFVTIRNPEHVAGAGGIRYFGGTGFRALNCHVESGDDALQFTPIWSPTPIRDLSISDGAYINCTGHAWEGRSMVVMLQSSAPVGQGGLTCSVSDVRFLACSGSGRRRGIGVSNTDSTGSVDGVTFTDCTVDQSNAPAYGGQDIYIERGAYGPVRNVGFRRLRIIAPPTSALGTTGNATNGQYVENVLLEDCTLDAPRSSTSTVKALAVDGLTIRGGTVHGVGTAHVIEGAGSTNSSRDVVVDGATVTGVGTGYAGVRIPETVGWAVRGVRFKPAPGATSGSGVSLSAASPRGVLQGNDFTQLAGAPTAGTIPAGTIVRDNLGLPGSTSGVGTIADGQLTVSVPHGLGTTPTAVTIAKRTSEDIWVSGRGNNTVTVARAGTTGALTFDWNAVYQP